MNAMIAMSSTSCHRSWVKISSMRRFPGFRRTEAKRAGARQGPHGLFDVVDPNHVRACERGGDRGGEAPFQTLFGAEIEQAADECLARGADEDRQPRRRERRQFPQQ